MKKKWIPTLLLLGLFMVSEAFFLPDQAPSIRPARQLAIFFAVNDYQAAPYWPNLKNPIRDAEALASLLFDHYNFDTLIYRNPTKRKITATLTDLQQHSSTEIKQLFVSFSGHGDFWEEASEGHFVPKGSPLKSFDEYIELETLGKLVTNIPCKHILMAIDACYSGTIDEAMAIKFRGDGLRITIEEINARKKFLEQQWTFKTRLFVTSGGKVQTPEGNDHSPFTTAILEGLRQTITQGDGFFAYEDLLAYLSRVDPLPHKGKLPGHKQGGFVFVTHDTLLRPSPITGFTSIERPAQKRQRGYIPFNLETSSSIKGIVVDKQQLPVEGVRVLTVEGQVYITGKDGKFTVELPSGQEISALQLYFSKSGYQHLTHEAKSTHNNMITLHPTPSIKGVVVDRLGQPLEGARVITGQGDVQTTGKDGKFGFALPAGQKSPTMTLYFSKRGYKRLSRLFTAPFNNTVILQKE